MAFAIAGPVSSALGVQAGRGPENLKPRASNRIAFEAPGGIVLDLAALCMLNAYAFLVRPCRLVFRHGRTHYNTVSDMIRRRTSLGDDVLAAFARACREQDFAVAEYLLQALEALARRDGNELPLQRAYRELIGSLRKEQ